VCGPGLARARELGWGRGIAARAANGSTHWDISLGSCCDEHLVSLFCTTCMAGRGGLAGAASSAGWNANLAVGWAVCRSARCLCMLAGRQGLSACATEQKSRKRRGKATHPHRGKHAATTCGRLLRPGCSLRAHAIWGLSGTGWRQARVAECLHRPHGARSAISRVGARRAM